MKSIPARKSSFSPTPSSNAPSLTPTPRKLNRSTAHPSRQKAFAAWYTTFVCIVPPWSGCGWQKTTAAVGGVASRPSASSRRPCGRACRAGVVDERFERAGRTGDVEDHGRLSAHVPRVGGGEVAAAGSRDARGRAHRAHDRLGHGVGRERADGQHVRCALARARGEREDRVAVEHRVRRRNRPGQAVVRQLRHPVRLRLGERGVGGHDADRRVAPDETRGLQLRPSGSACARRRGPCRRPCERPR